MGFVFQYFTKLNLEFSLNFDFLHSWESFFNSCYLFPTESVLVVKDLGVQFTRAGVFGRQRSQFIEQHRIVDVLINEVITMVCQVCFALLWNLRNKYRWLSTMDFFVLQKLFCWLVIVLGYMFVLFSVFWIFCVMSFGDRNFCNTNNYY